MKPDSKSCSQSILISTSFFFSNTYVVSRIKKYFIMIGFETKVDGNAWSIAVSLRGEFKKWV